MEAIDASEELPVFAQNLQRILEERNLQQSEVAEASGLKRDAFGRYYHGKTMPPAKKLLAIARALKVKPSDINPEATGLDDVEASEVSGDPIYQLTPALSRRPGYLMLKINMEMPARIAVRIVEEIEDQLRQEAE